MREELAKLCGVRRRFEAVFERFGKKTGYRDVLTTILLKDVRVVASRKLVTDHLWFTLGKGFEALNLVQGDVVRFDARVTEYIKGYRGRRDDDDYDDCDRKPLERDYRLSFPTKFIKVSKTAVPDLIGVKS